MNITTGSAADGDAETKTLLLPGLKTREGSMSREGSISSTKRASSVQGSRNRCVWAVGHPSPQMDPSMWSGRSATRQSSSAKAANGSGKSQRSLMPVSMTRDRVQTLGPSQAGPQPPPEKKTPGANAGGSVLLLLSAVPSLGPSHHGDCPFFGSTRRWAIRGGSVRSGSRSWPGPGRSRQPAA